MLHFSTDVIQPCLIYRTRKIRHGWITSVEKCNIKKCGYRIMATKVGLSYYTVDTDRYLDIRIKRLRKDYGCRGLAVYDYVLCEVYRDRGCFIEWDESTAFDVAEYLGLKESVVQDIVKYCAVVGLFNEALLRRGIITSASIQKRYLEMATRAKRKAVTIPEICKIPEVEAKIPEVRPQVREVDAKIRENSGSSSQIKEKKSKINNPSIIPPRGDEQEVKDSENLDKNFSFSSPELRGTPSKDFVKFQDWIQDNAPRVAKMKEPFSESQFSALKKDFDTNFICDLLRAMHNYEPLLKKNRSAYLTFKDWAKRRENDHPNVERSKHAIASYDGKKEFKKF